MNGVYQLVLSSLTGPCWGWMLPGRTDFKEQKASARDTAMPNGMTLCSVPLAVSTHNTCVCALGSPEHLLAEGLWGGSASYFPLSEPLPLVGVLGVLLPASGQSQARAVYCVEELAALALPAANQLGSAAFAHERQEQQQQADHNAHILAPQHLFTDASTGVEATQSVDAYQPTAAAQQPVLGSSPNSTSGSVDEFESWMRQVSAWCEHGVWQLVSVADTCSAYQTRALQLAGCFQR